MFNKARDSQMAADYLKQTVYWLGRFELSRDVNHLDNAERNFEVVRLCLGDSFKNLDFNTLKNYVETYLSKRSSIRIGEFNEF